MTNLASVAPNYLRARDRWPDAPALTAHYATLLDAHDGTRQSLIEAVKSYLECVCRTILADYGVAPDSFSSTTELLGAALDRLGLRNMRGAGRFDRVLSAHNRLADALSDARNHDGPVAHGKDGFLDALADHHVRLYLLTGDTILSLLLGAVDGSEPNLNHTREPYERFAHFNEAIDGGVGVHSEIDMENGAVILEFRTAGLREGLELRTEPSRLLYCLDRAAYVEVLESLPRAAVLKVDDRLDGGTPARPEPKAAPTAAPAPANVPSVYSGRFDPLRADLVAFLESEGLRPKDARQLEDPLLVTADDNAVVDWAKREPMRARMLVKIRRLLAVKGPKHPPPDFLASRIVDWLHVQEHVIARKTGRRAMAEGGTQVSPTQRSRKGTSKKNSPANKSASEKKAVKKKAVKKKAVKKKAVKKKAVKKKAVKKKADVGSSANRHAKKAPAKQRSRHVRGGGR